jgi:tetratricopeptide (TPR) repeat protein
VEPGQLSALLLAIAADPGEPGGDWQRELVPGEQVGRFRLLRRIGRGGFGVVYEARDEALQRSVALKSVRTGGRSALRQERLLLEAEAAARLSHPNIVTLFDVGRCEQGLYLVLELLRGESLADRVARGPLAPLDAVRVAGEVARGVAHAHAHGVIHRDLKPGNVFLCADGPVKVLDFGLAHAFGHPRPAGGTPAYMAPEQRSGAPEDERTDVFALGVILYQMLTGELPFGTDGSRPSRRRARPLEIAQTPALAELAERMLERDPVRRPRDGGEVAAALIGIQHELEGAAPSPSRPVRARRRWRLALASATASLATGVAVHWLWPPAPAPPPPAQRVALADVANETGEPELELSGLLRTVLEQSTWLDVLPRARLLDALRGRTAEGVARIDEGTGMEAARLCGVQALLVTRLLRFGDTYLMEVRAVDPATGERRFSFKEQERGKEGVPGLLDRVGEQVRLRLGEDPAAIRERTMPARAVTTSLGAWRHYASGMACFEERSFAGSFDACLADLRAATAIDPGFALAHLQISLLHFLQGTPRALQKAALEQAQRSPERIPPRDRLRMRGWAAFLDGREVEAKALLRDAAEGAPDDKYAWWLAGDVRYHRDEFAEALPFFRRVHALDPGWLDATQHLVQALGATADLEGIRGLAAELAALGPKPGALAALCYAELWVDPSRAVATCERARAAGAGEIGDQLLAIALLNRGEQDRLAAHLHGMSGRAGPRSFDWYMALWLLCQEGRWPEVLRRSAAAGDPEDSWFHSTLVEMIAGSGDLERGWREALRILELDRALLTNLAVHLAYLGDLRRAAEMASYLPPGSPRVEAYQAVVRWRNGDLTGAVELLRKVAAGAPQSADPAIPPPLYLLGEALAEAGRDAEAVDALRRFLALPVNYPTWFRPRGLYFLGRSLDRLGDREGARQALDTLLRLWVRASPEQPLLAEARALGARLGLR